MNIVFAGTPEFAVPSLEILSAQHAIMACVTQPDRAVGRGQKTKPSPVKKACLNYGITVFDKPINNLFDKLSAIKPDLIVVVAYGQILNQKILNMPKYGCINIHASLLPKYRGASPIQASILNGDNKTGVSLIKMINKMDAGPIIAQEESKINKNDTAGTLHNKLMDIGAKILYKSLKKNILTGKEQNHKKATYVSKISTNDAKLHANDSATVAERKVRAFNPWPGAWIKLASAKRLKIFKAQIKKDVANTPLLTKHGNLKLAIIQNQPAILCADNTFLILTHVQLEGKKKMSGQNFAKGHLNKIQQ